MELLQDPWQHLQLKELYAQIFPDVRPKICYILLIRIPYCDIGEIEKILNSDLPIEEAVVKLIKKANIRGGTDNITIAYLKKESGDE